MDRNILGIYSIWNWQPGDKSCSFSSNFGVDASPMADDIRGVIVPCLFLLVVKFETL